jgi:hypothetical protein
MAGTLEKEFQYYLDHQDELVTEYNGKVIVIKNQVVIGVYDDETEAIGETRKTQAMGTFLVQRCTPGTDAYTAKYHSRAVFA